MILIFDIGKTNKKLVLFDDTYRLIKETSVQLPQSTDEDGHECEDAGLLAAWIRSAFNAIISAGDYDIKAVNFSAYGASFVHLGNNLQPVTPLYSYLKPYPAVIKKQFYDTYGGEQSISMQTASPVLDSLNSGMQLYRLKHEKPAMFAQIWVSLHLPQYLSYLICGGLFSDMTSIGCHTGLWDFIKNDYHRWVYKEKIDAILAPIYKGDQVTSLAYRDKLLHVGTGLHDSSAALIPYLAAFNEPFILLSTGTWCISLNPFNQSPLTAEELAADCLNYITYEGRTVKASRLFAGYEHEVQTKKLATHFNKPADHYKTIGYNKAVIDKLSNIESFAKDAQQAEAAPLVAYSFFGSRDLTLFSTYAAAYHQLIADLVNQQVTATTRVMQHGGVNKLFVDGGFSQNPVYMNLLSQAFPEISVYAATVAQATALGAALAIHKHWNPQPVPADIIALKLYA